jgi:hypothetical protein
MFVRTKTTRSGTVKHYLVECRREGGKVRQKVLYYLGAHPTVEAKVAYLERESREYRERAAATPGNPRALPQYDNHAYYLAMARRSERERDRLLSIADGKRP